MLALLRRSLCEPRPDSAVLLAVLLFACEPGGAPTPAGQAQEVPAAAALPRAPGPGRAEPAKKPDALRRPGGSPPSFVWVDASGGGRAQVVWFRRELELDALPSTARLSLFARSRYLLFVNGRVVGSGPARAYPEHPEVDGFDLRPHLAVGRNILAVQVLSFGTESFQLRRQPGAFVAWGQVQGRARVHDLATPGEWRAKRDLGYDATAPRMSFALPPIEIHDARLGARGATAGGGDGWGSPVPLADPPAWSSLGPRSIPPLTATWTEPTRLHGAFALDASEQLLSFRVPVPDATRAQYEQSRLLYARTRIFSPRAQRVPLGLWWGSYYVNGEGPLESAGVSPGQYNRNLVWAPLRAGYNDFFVRYESVFGPWDFYLAVPRGSGLELSAHGRRDDPVQFESAGPFPPDLERRLQSLPMPLPRAAPPGSIGAEVHWRPVMAGERRVNPAVEVSWRKLGPALPLLASAVRDVSIAAGRDTALVFDMGGTVLGRVKVDYEAPAGTSLDLAWAEELSGERPAVLRQHGLFSGAHHVSAGGASTFQTIQPYGMRYLQLNVAGHTAQVEIRRIGVVEEVYPFAQRGRFHSSDAALDALWAMGWRTLRVCAEDAYIDTPFRERALYAGDLLVEIAVTQVANGDLRLAKRSLRLLADMYRDLFVAGAERHPDQRELLEDYPLLSLEAYAWLVGSTGDLDFARELFDGYRHLLDGRLARLGAGGALRNESVFISWVLPDEQRHGAENTAYHALLARSLSSLAGVARRLGEADSGARYEAASRRLSRVLGERFWDPRAGAFADGVRGGLLSSSHSVISSAWPSFWGLTSAAQERELQALWEREVGPAAPLPPRISPYGAFFLLGALYRHDHAALAEHLMRGLWAPMLADPEGTLWEGLDRAGGSSSHAWSAAPTYYLSTEVLGVQLGYPEAAPDDEILIAPRAETLDWARGAVVHPRGLVEVDWRIAGDRLQVEVHVPPGVRYRVAPRGRLSRLRLERIRGAKRPGAGSASSR